MSGQLKRIMVDNWYGRSVIVAIIGGTGIQIPNVRIAGIRRNETIPTDK